MNELDKLRPEVREALDEVTHCTECMHFAGYSDGPDTIRAELLRLPLVEAELASLKAKITESARVQWVGAYCGENSYAEFKEPREGYQIYAVVALTEQPAERGEE